MNENKQIIAAEALIRWRQPDGTVIAPADFIPFAEKNSLILPIGTWVLDEACKTLSEWAKNPVTASLRLAVNLSARQFHAPNFYDSICALLDRYAVNPALLELELTESIVIGSISDAINTMNALKQLGLHLSLDDFGSGFSSLTSLKRLPFDHLKIDQTFVRDIMNDRDDATIVRTIIAMGKALRLVVTAEGVETETQYRYLQRKGCKRFQGYLFSQPVPLDQFHILLQSQQTAEALPGLAEH